MNLEAPAQSLTAADPGADRAVRAWQRFCAGAGRRPAAMPAQVVRLKRQTRPWNKSAVYRLDGVADDGSPVVAKRCLQSTGRIERQVYERILPRTSMPSLRYHGYLEEEGSPFCWLFFADAGGVKPTMADRGRLAEWLTRMHVATAPLSREVTLPDCGPDAYRGRLPVARSGLEAVRRAVPSASDGEVVASLAASLDLVESRWDYVSGACDGWPWTLVHGDFTRKNVRLLRAGGVLHVIAIDWETAGWGPPAADLADLAWSPPRQIGGDLETSWYGPVSLEAYASAIGELRPAADFDDVRRLSSAGAVFRIIDAIGWAAHQVRSGAVEKGMGMLRAYAADLRRVTAALDCVEAPRQ